MVFSIHPENIGVEILNDLHLHKESEVIFRPGSKFIVESITQSKVPVYIDEDAVIHDNGVISIDNDAVLKPSAPLFNTDGTGITHPKAAFEHYINT